MVFSPFYTADIQSLDHLQGEQTFISRLLYESLVIRLEERRTILSDVLAYLHFGQKNSSIHQHLQTRPPTKQQISKLIILTLRQNEMSDDFQKEESTRRDVFSSAGYLCNKFCSKLSDANLANLVFLRSYFQIKDSKNTALPKYVFDYSCKIKVREVRRTQN